MTAWWRRSLIWQFIGFMLISLFIGQFISLGISWKQRQSAIRESAQSELVGRTSALANALGTMSQQMRDDVFLASATMFTRFWISAGDPRADPGAWYSGAVRHLQLPLPGMSGTSVKIGGHKISNNLPAEAAAPLPQWSELHSPLWVYPTPASFVDFDGRNGMGIVVQLRDGTWLNAAGYKTVVPDIWQSLMATGITALVLSVIGVLSARRIARPLRELTVSAEALGRGEAVSTIPENGPDDVRKLCEAFNLMQLRLRRFVDDRTRMLGAIGHDLRTPLTTLRLRAEFVADEELQQKMLATIGEMQAMTEATLALAKNESAVEETRTVDLNALVGSLCDDLAELGHDVEYADAAKMNYRCRPDGLKRAVRNLVENAVRYAGGASVRIDTSAQSIDIVVDDRGPGIPSHELECVFAPFYRVEQSRSRETGGVGLGLSIARAIVRHHGGDIVLLPNNPGLRASVSLPRA